MWVMIGGWLSQERASWQSMGYSVSDAIFLTCTIIAFKGQRPESIHPRLTAKVAVNPFEADLCEWYSSGPLIPSAHSVAVALG